MKKINVRLGRARVFSRVVLSLYVITILMLPLGIHISSLAPPTRVKAAAEQTQAANWFDAAWQYRRPINVSNTSAAALTNYQVEISLTASSFNFGQSNGNDLRFTASDGTTLLSHWTEYYNVDTETARLYVLLPQLAAASSNTVYMYYGSSTAPNTSSGPKTFSFFDGFERLKNASTPLETPTYDNSGQTVHPDVVHFKDGWNGYKYWMATTPYPGGNDQLENPSILASNDGLSWDVPAGVTNPLVSVPPCDHNSDPDMLYNDATGELWLYYLDTRRASHCAGHQSQPYYNHNYVKLIKSSDGIHWSQPITVVDWDLDSTPLYVSPSIVKVGSAFYFWAVNATNFTIRTAQSSDGLTFGNSQAVSIGHSVWHLDVEYIPSKNEYWMLYNYPSTPNGIIRFARSTNRTSWTTYPNPALSYTSGWDSNLYRSSFTYDPSTNVIRVWYSAHSSGKIWRTGHTSADYNEFLNGLSAAGGWSREQGNGVWTTAASPRRGSQSARLTQEAGVSLLLSKPAPLANNFYMETDIYDDMDTSAFKMARVTNSSDNRLGVGVWTGASTTHYAYHNKAYGYTVTSVPRTAGWHKFGVMIKANSSLTFFIDGQNVGTMSGQFNNVNQIQVEGYSGGLTSYYIDDIRVRKWNYPEPAAAVGAEEGQAAYLAGQQ